MKPSGLLFDGEWRRACRVAPTTRAEAEAMIRAHYIGKWPGVCVLILGLSLAEKLIGVIVYALPPRETSKRYGALTWELARLWIDDGVPANAESFFISRSVKYIKKNKPEVACLVSYADPSVGHKGTIYKAANWQPDGRTDQERRTPRFDYADAATGKRYSRKGHVPEGVEIKRIPRVSKYRFMYRFENKQRGPR